MAPVSLRDKVVRVSKLVVVSYIIDWILILGVAGIGGGFAKINGNQEPFALTDLSISYPYQVNETVSTALLGVIALVIPAVVIVVGSLLIVPTPTALKNAPFALIWRRKLWEWNAGWLGLGVALAGAFVSTEGLKDLAGKPRPDFLGRCDPDVTQVAKYMVSGLGQHVANAPILVTSGICRNGGWTVYNDGFASFPSGHSSFSFAGMLYLSLWFCAKFSISFPYLGPRIYGFENPRSVLPQRHHLHSSRTKEENGAAFSTDASNNDYTSPPSLRNQGAAPPVYLQILAFVPICVASFVAVSRWFNHRHHGFDILFGSALGIVFAYIGFRMYHVPIRRSDGWAWAARGRKHAFYRGIGYADIIASGGWADDEITSGGGEEVLANEREPARGLNGDSYGQERDAGQDLEQGNATPI